MKEQKEATVSYLAFYPSYYETITNYLPEEDQLAAMKALLEYGLYGMEPPEDIKPEIRIIFSMARPTIDKHRRDIENGKKGGRPRKEDGTETGVKTGVKTGANTKKEKEKERDMEREKDISFPFSYKDTESAAPPAPDGGGSASSPFSFADVLDTIEEHGIDLTEAEARGFYDWMEKYGWQINGNRVSKLENAIRGYAKKHHKKAEKAEPEESPEEKEQKELKRQTDQQAVKKWEGIMERGRPAYTRPSKDIPDQLRTLMIRDKISEWDLQQFVGIRTTWLTPTEKTPVSEYDQNTITSVLRIWSAVSNMVNCYERD